MSNTRATGIFSRIRPQTRHQHNLQQVHSTLCGLPVCAPKADFHFESLDALLMHCPLCCVVLRCVALRCARANPSFRRGSLTQQ